MVAYFARATAVLLALTCTACLPVMRPPGDSGSTSTSTSTSLSVALDLRPQRPGSDQRRRGEPENGQDPCTMAPTGLADCPARPACLVDGQGRWQCP